ncbi:WIAG-tail domain, partial [Polycladomyces subterraneus]
LADQSVDTPKIASQAIVSDHLTPGSISGSHIQNQAISTQHLAPDTVQSHHIQAGAIGRGHLADQSVSTAKIESQAVGSDHLAPESISGSHIQDQAVSTQHLAPHCVQSHHIQAGAIGQDHLADQSIGVEKLAFDPSLMFGGNNLRTGIQGFTLHAGKDAVLIEVPVTPTFETDEYIVVAMTDQPYCMVSLASRSRQAFTIRVQRMGEDHLLLQGFFFWIAALPTSSTTWSKIPVSDKNSSEGLKESEIFAKVSQTPSQSEATEIVTHEIPTEADDLPFTSLNQSSTIDHLSEKDIFAASNEQMETSDEETGTSDGETMESYATHDKHSQTDESDEGDDLNGEMK